MEFTTLTRRVAEASGTTPRGRAGDVVVEPATRMGRMSAPDSSPAAPRPSDETGLPTPTPAAPSPRPYGERVRVRGRRGANRTAAPHCRAKAPWRRKSTRRRLCLHPRPADAGRPGSRRRASRRRRLRHRDQFARPDAGRAGRLFAGDRARPRRLCAARTSGGRRPARRRAGRGPDPVREALAAIKPLLEDRRC
jgi:hypothetical protein